MMEYSGTVKNGVVVLEEGCALRDGAHVRVLPKNEEDLPTLASRFERVTGKAEGLPDDLALNHDHYVHGQPKRGTT